MFLFSGRFSEDWGSGVSGLGPPAWSSPVYQAESRVQNAMQIWFLFARCCQNKCKSLRRVPIPRWASTGKN